MIVFATPDEEATMVDRYLPTLLREMEALFLKYVTFTDPRHAFICSLWCAQTWLFRASDLHGINTIGYLAFASPVKNCGKTAALSVTASLSYGQPNINITPTSATIFRDIGETRATIILDELDGLSEDTDLINILNAGYKKGAKVKRMIGRDREKVGEFETFCPKALGYIRNDKTLRAIKGTLESRCIRILLKKRTLEEEARAAKLFEDVLDHETGAIVERLMKWQFTVGNLQSIYQRFHLPNWDGREQEVWRTLLAIAELAGRFDEALETAKGIVVANREEVEDHRSDTPLLTDLRDNLDLMCDEDGFALELAVDWLLQMEDRNYRKWIEGRGLTTIHLAKTLSKYGLRSRPVGKTRRKRIEKPDLLDVLSRYIPVG